MTFSKPFRTGLKHYVLGQSFTRFLSVCLIGIISTTIFATDISKTAIQASDSKSPALLPAQSFTSDLSFDIFVKERKHVPDPEYANLSFYVLIGSTPGTVEIPECYDRYFSFGIGSGKYLSTYVAELKKKKISRIRLTDCTNAQLAELKNSGFLDSLESLHLSGCDISDLTPLKGLTNLKCLALVKCEKLSDLNPLAGLKNLRWLRISYCEKASDLTPLENLTNLEYFCFSYRSAITDLTPIANLKKLKFLTLWCCKLSDAKALVGLTNLKDLSLWECGVTDLEPLSKLTNLKILALSCQKTTNLKPLANLINVKRLYLYKFENLTDLIPLENLKNLTSLNLSGCSKVSSLKPLANLADLEDLNLAACHEIDSLKSLANLKKLKELNMFENKNITKSDIAELQEKLPELKIKLQK